VKKLIALLVGAAVATTAAGAVAAGHKTVWTAPLTSGQEAPKQVVKNAPAHGLFKGSLSGSKLTFSLTFAKLTGQATAAHIHMGGMGVSGPVVVPLCGPCTSPVKGTVTISNTLVAAFKKHDLYVNVHTDANKGGEVRAQLKP